MKVKGTKTEFVEVDISTSDISNLIDNGEYTNIQTLFSGARRSWILRVTGLSGEVYIKDGYWYTAWEEDGGGHSWSATEKMTKATKIEKDIWDRFVELEKALRVYS